MIVSVPGIVFHHVGVASRDLKADAAMYAGLGYTPDGVEFEDPLQKIRGLFLVGPGARIELVSPLDESSPVESWLNRGARIYHLAYETTNLLQSINDMRVVSRAKLVAKPVPAVAFNGRRVAFLLLPTMVLIELVESATAF